MAEGEVNTGATGYVKGNAGIVSGTASVDANGNVQTSLGAGRIGWGVSAGVQIVGW